MVLCFDIGGTFIKYALIENIDNIDVKKIPTRKTKDDNFVLCDIKKIIRDYIDQGKKIDAIGIATAGVVDSKNGVVTFLGPTIPNYSNTEFAKEIKEEFYIDVLVENDVNAATYGEYKYGNYKGSMFGFTVGTGVGGALIIDSHLYNGAHMTAGEIGYVPFKGGYFQDFASTNFLINYVSEKLKKEVDGKYIFENAKKGDVLCNEAIDEFVENLSFGISYVLYIINPDTIIIGGGITAQGKYLEDLIIKKLQNKIISKQFKANIKLAKLENTAGICGMYYKVKDELL